MCGDLREKGQGQQVGGTNKSQENGHLLAGYKLSAKS